MKHIILLTLLCIITSLSSCTKAHAGWFGNSSGTDYKQQIAQIENQLSIQRKYTNNWQMTAAGLSVGCILLFTIGTALGAKTRRHVTEPTI